MNQKIGTFELELLLYLADSGPLPTRILFQEFGLPRQVGRTSVLKTLDRLMAKGFAEREEVGNLWHYRSKRSRAELEQERVQEFVQSAFGGDTRPLVQFLSGGAAINQRDLAELKSLVQKLSGGADQ
ncbi:MAG: BlaI/MecI/CopY family transcriptional regulator [Chthonomonas sp.]|nr:BlaI/MecI/CopY family transcriptional regulator [Chthonomonas sp.]